MDITRIPGLIVELVLYLFDVIPPFLPQIMALATPIALGALCGVMCERSGVVNIGIEGIMLMSAFFGYLTGFLLHDTIGDLPSLVLGVGVAIVVGMVLGTIHAWLSITIRADQIIAGVFLNVFALGLTSYLNRLIITPSGRGGAGQLPKFGVPADVVNIPILGPILSMFLDQGPIAMSVLVFVVGLQILLFRSRWGLRTRAVGEHPKAADTVGINVYWVRYSNVILGGMVAGLGGAYFTIGSTGGFERDMTAGRGYIGLAAMIFGGWNPIGSFLAGLVFGFADAIQSRFSILSIGIPSEFLLMVPYVVTIIVVAGLVGRARAPAADGKPYIKE
jgi:general nucleoside transport system permease protein